MADVTAPRVGVLSLPVTPSMRQDLAKKQESGEISPSLADRLTEGSFVPSSVLNWLRDGGTEPVLLDFHRRDGLPAALDELDGLVLTGGSTPIFAPQTEAPTSYLLLIAALLAKAKFINKSRAFPIWAICLGFEALLIAEGGLVPRLAVIENRGKQSFPLTGAKAGSSMFAGLTAAELAGPNFLYKHKYAIPVEAFSALPGVELTGELHFQGRRWAATFKFRDFPFFGWQFHPEVFHFEPAEGADKDGHLKKREINAKFARALAKSCGRRPSSRPPPGPFFAHKVTLSNFSLYPEAVILYT